MRRQDLRRLNRARDDAQAAADDVLKRYEHDGQPFVLYLCSFGAIQVGWSKTERGWFTEDHLALELPDGVGIVRIADQEQLIGLETTAPTLVVGTDAWQGVVAELIRDADVIVALCLALSPGIEWELMVSLALNKLDQTIVLVPPPGYGFDLLDHEPLIQRFPRCTWIDDIFQPRISNHLLFADLWQRITTLASEPAESRGRLRDPAARLREHPVTYDGVIPGYVKHVLAYASREQDEHTWYRKYLAESRGVGIGCLLLERGLVSFTEAASHLVYLYLELAKDMLRGERRGETHVLVGDPELAGRCLASAHAILERARSTRPSDSWVDEGSRVLGHLVNELQALQQLIRAGTVIVESRVGGLPASTALSLEDFG